VNLNSDFLVTLAVLSALFLITSCQQTPLRPVDDNVRAAVDALDRDTADARKARLSNVAYNTYIDIASSKDEFLGDVTIRFDLSDASADLTVDFTGGVVSMLQVNGVSVAADYNGYFITVPAEQMQLGANTVQVTYSHPFGMDGTGLHHFVDPEDGLTYLHSYLWPYYANRLLPSFDQPSLKANFSLHVLAPENWVVVSTTPGSAEASDNGVMLWTFEETPKLSTYIFSLHAGPYKVWRDDSGDVPLRLFARQSLAEHVAVDEWFDITQKGMQFYSRYFDIPYPFEKYDQLIVPEFNIGGMENAAAVTFTERYVQRQQSDRAQRESRAGTVLHELAHMWFGDLVTHDWWNGMWLNESFATQMATMAQTETTEFTDKRHGFFIDGKQRAYQRDSRVTTHAIEMPVRSTDQFSNLFDAITYQKGGSALKQLQHLVGAESYRQGVSAYLKENAWGTTELSDFIEYQEKHSGIDLATWTDQWLLTPGFNTLAVETECESDVLRSLAITQSAPKDHPYIRAHQVDLAMYNVDSSGAVAVTDTISVQIDRGYTMVDVAEGQPCPVIVNPNHNDWGYAKIVLSDDDEAVLSEHLADVADPLSRSMFLAAMFDKAMAGEMPIADFVRLALRLADTEQNLRVVEQITSSLTHSINIMQRLRPETNKVLPRLLDDVKELALRRAHFAETQDLKFMWFNLFLGVVSSDAGLGTARALLDGKADIEGIEMSPEIRWQLLTILSRHDAADIEALLDAEIKRDPSNFGERSVLSARAAAPSTANKAFWVDELQNPHSLNNLARQRAVMGALFPATQTELQLDLLVKILGALPQMSRDADVYFLSSYATSLLTPMCREESTALMQATLDEFGDELNPTALRFLREAHQADAECQELRAAQ